MLWLFAFHFILQCNLTSSKIINLTQFSVSHAAKILSRIFILRVGVIFVTWSWSDARAGWWKEPNRVWARLFRTDKLILLMLKAEIKLKFSSKFIFGYIIYRFAFVLYNERIVLSFWPDQRVISSEGNLVMIGLKPTTCFNCRQKYCLTVLEIVFIRVIHFFFTKKHVFRFVVWKDTFYVSKYRSLLRLPVKYNSDFSR